MPELPDPPSWMGIGTMSTVPPPPPPPPPAEQVAVPPPTSASITCTVGQMSTRVDLANMQDFDRYGTQILQQAHLGATCLATPPAAQPINLQMMHRSFTSAAPNITIQNVPGNLQPGIQSASASTEPVASIQPYVPRPISNPMLSEWPPAKDNSLPKEGSFVLNVLWVCLPQNYQYEIARMCGDSLEAKPNNLRSAGV